MLEAPHLDMVGLCPVFLEPFCPLLTGPTKHVRCNSAARLLFFMYADDLVGIGGFSWRISRLNYLLCSWGCVLGPRVSSCR